MAFMAFLLLIAALVMFIVSTNQWALPARGAVWGGGLLAIILGWTVLGNTKRDPELATALADFVGKIFNPGDSMLAKMYASNSGTVEDIILSLFDIFQVFAVIVGIIALIAFTPGDRLERILRPIMMGMIGAVFGGLFALAIVGTGFGEGKERQSYAGVARLDTVFDGNTVLLNNTLLKLRGIAVPEAGQPCRRNGTVFDCAAETKTALSRVVEGAFLSCVPEKADTTVATNNAAGRVSRVATCTGTRGDSEPFNIARRMVEDGWALDTAGAFSEQSYKAIALGKGLYAFCTVRPDAWARLSQKDRTAFRDTGAVPANTATIGVCPLPKGGKKPPGPVKDKRVEMPK